MSEETIQPEPEKEPDLKEIYQAAVDSPYRRLEGEPYEDYRARIKLKNKLYKIYLKGQNIDIA